MPHTKTENNRHSGSPPDLEKLVVDHYARVYRFAANRVGSEAASDIAQDTFLTMQKSISKFRGQANVSTFILGITQNLCRNYSRKKANQELPLEHWIESHGDNEEHLINRQLLKNALKKLSPEHQEVVLLHEIEELTYKEIAEIVGIPEGTVKSRLYHAFSALRKDLCGGTP